MSISRAYVGEVSREGGVQRIRKGSAHVAKVVFALALVLSATFALAETELLVANASHLSNTDLVTILSAGEGL
jgi:hypothetical protein